MEEIKNISEMADLQKLIAEKTKNNIETGIYEIKNSLEALQDMQDIIAVLVKECDNRQNQRNDGCLLHGEAGAGHAAGASGGRGAILHQVPGCDP